MNVFASANHGWQVFCASVFMKEPDNSLEEQIGR